MNDYLAGSTSVVETVRLLDSTSTTGGGKTGLLYSTSGLTCYYKRSNGPASVSVTLGTITTLGTYVSGGFKEIDATNLPGEYEFHPPDAAMVAGAKWVEFYFVGATGLAQRKIRFRLLAVNPDSATAFISGVNSLAPPTRWNALLIDANGRVDVGSHFGTPQTAGRDLGLVLPSATAGSASGGLPICIDVNGAGFAGVYTRLMAVGGTDGSFDVADYLRPVRVGVCQATGNTTTAVKLDAGASATDNDRQYVGHPLYLYRNTGTGQVAVITAYSGTTKIATVAPALTTAAGVTTKFAILPAIAAALDASLRPGVDWSNVGAPTSTVNLSGTTFGTLVADVAAAVWAVLTSTLTAAGSIGSYLLTQLGLITTGQVNVLGGYANGTLTVREGDSYDSGSGQVLRVTKPTGASWPSDLFSASGPAWVVTLSAAKKSTNDATGTATLTKACVVEDAGNVRIDLAGTDTTGLALGTNGWTWELVATRATTPALQNTLISGNMTVVD